VRFLITGGVGFIGSNAAHHFARQGHDVVVFDNFARPGCRQNLTWLRDTGSASCVEGDVTDAAAVREAVTAYRPDVVLHLAAQVAVTTSVVAPRADFESNALGTLNVLEAVRERQPGAIVIYASTNKVYGALAGREIVTQGTRHGFAGARTTVDEREPLDFYSPYGCSKGAADQYVRDYARTYGLRTVVLRQSCIYGPRQFGMEDQGWVAWFTIAAALGRPFTIYGDGKQVRDVLFVDDLVDLFERAVQQIDTAAGQVFNVGGGPEFQLSLLDLIEQLEQLHRRPLVYGFDDWRPGDQKVYLSDIGKSHALLGWRPKVSPVEGVRRLHEWVAAHRDLVREIVAER
jgi:CDP-paratose 2-epimerase